MKDFWNAIMFWETYSHGYPNLLAIVGLILKSSVVIFLLLLILGLTKRKSAHTRFTIVFAGLLLSAILPLFRWIPAPNPLSLNLNITMNRYLQVGEKKEKALSKQRKEIDEQMNKSMVKFSLFPSKSDSLIQQVEQKRLSSSLWSFPSLLIFLNDWLASLWLLIGISWFLKTLFCHLWVWRKTKSMRETLDPLVQNPLKSICNHLCISSYPKVLISPSDLFPYTTGFFHPLIVLPSHSRTWKSEEMESVLIHEIEHCRRHDSLYLFVARLISTLYCFNPAFRLLKRRLQREIESIADDAVVQTGKSPQDYAQMLYQFSIFPNSWVSHASLPLLGQNGLEERIQRLFEPDQKRGEISWVLIFSSLFFLGSLSFLLGNAKIQKNISVTASDLTDPYQPNLNPRITPDLESKLRKILSISIYDSNPRIVKSEISHFAINPENSELVRSPQISYATSYLSSIVKPFQMRLDRSPVIQANQGKTVEFNTFYSQISGINKTVEFRQTRYSDARHHNHPPLVSTINDDCINDWYVRYAGEIQPYDLYRALSSIGHLFENYKPEIIPVITYDFAEKDQMIIVDLIAHNERGAATLTSRYSFELEPIPHLVSIEMITQNVNDPLPKSFYKTLFDNYQMTEKGVYRPMKLRFLNKNDGFESGFDLEVKSIEYVKQFPENTFDPEKLFKK